ncbi:MAG: hypothetical protein Ct9H300mP15_13440 [Gemmatimonadota bacterium]|nr:MAG: hypothetical protein Ct9H300mP15_13440 [Gemmatimonadota bacterium]
MGSLKLPLGPDPARAGGRASAVAHVWAGKDPERR